MNPHNDKQPYVIDSETDDDDDDLSRAIALSLQDMGPQHGSQPTAPPQQYEQQLDRHAQEQDDMKLALALSLGKTVDQLTARDILTMGSMDSTALITNDTQRKRPRSMDDPFGSVKKPNITTLSYTKYWSGTVKLTHIPGFFGPSFIRFEDIVQKVSSRKHWL
jgi:tyrosyl-DNA phosphodiesterase-1